MPKWVSWSDISIKYKLFGLVLLPITLLLYLAFRQVSLLNHQTDDLNKAKSVTTFLQAMSQIEHGDNSASSSTDAPVTTTDIQPLIADIYPQTEVAAMSDTLRSFLSASLQMKLQQNSEEALDSIEWQAELYQQLLASLERVPLKEAPITIQNDINALTQLEWMMFWASQETLLSQQLVENTQLDDEQKDELLSQIASLAQNQQLFVERFIKLNANEQQINFMLAAFSHESFQQSMVFRQALLTQNDSAPLSALETEAGLVALLARLEQLNGVALKIESQLVERIESATKIANNERLIFINAVSVLTFLVIFIAINLVRRVTNNLEVVLRYLKNDDDHQPDTLTKQITGNDELNRFAQEVERLTLERKQANERLTLAKNVAEDAKDAAIRASKAKSSFLANMSHEIRTPLNGVIGISEVLSDTSLTPTQRDYVDTIETSSQLLLSLINDILDFSKIESGMLLISHHSTNVRESIYDIASIIAPKAKEKGLDLRVTIDTNVPYKLMIDDHRLRQTLMNFMSNAVKFTEQGSVEIAIATEFDAKNGLTPPTTCQLEFSVRDSGIGIDDKQQKNIFEPFAQEDESTTRQFGGTGLGLAISTQLVELMGGKIQLESEKGVGSRFYFSLEFDIEHLHYPINRTAALSVGLISDNGSLSQTLVQELNFYDHQVTHRFETIEDYLADNLDSKPNVIIFLESTPDSAQQYLSHFNKIRKSGTQIGLIRSFKSRPFDFEHHVDALITRPFYGQRLARGLNRCVVPIADNPTSPENNVQHGKKILIVEDNTVNQKIAGLHLTKAGFEFDIANNGTEAVAIYSENPEHYAVILMDCMMPIMDGFEATSKIRHFEENTDKHVPIIALTASVIDDDIQRCFDVGMDDYIAKPFKAHILREKIDNFLPLPAISTVPLNTGPLNTEQAGTAHSDKPLNVDPLNSLTDHKEERTEIIPSAPKNATRSERVLLVEDNRVNQKVASIMLDKAGFGYAIAENGQIAIDMYSADSSFDVILMDCMMPVKDGFAATKEIRQYELSSGLVKTPIIALTASVIDDDIQRCFDSGMDAYIAKPVRKDNLIDKIESII